jgi:hypothetical protein
MLANDGAETLVAGSCAEALARFEACAPDVLISDIGLPDGNGYELLERIRVGPHGRAVPAIALTAFAGTDHAREALRRGYQAHLAKPFERLELTRLVRDLADARTRPS